MGRMSSVPTHRQIRRPRRAGRMRPTDSTSINITAGVFRRRKTVRHPIPLKAALPAGRRLCRMTRTRNPDWFTGRTDKAVQCRQDDRRFPIRSFRISALAKMLLSAKKRCNGPDASIRAIARLGHPAWSLLCRDQPQSRPKLARRRSQPPSPGSMSRCSAH